MLVATGNRKPLVSPYSMITLEFRNPSFFDPFCKRLAQNMALQDAKKLLACSLEAVDL